MSKFRVATKVASEEVLSDGGNRVSSSAIGIGCLLLFAASQGVRDAFFGNVLQSISFFLVATLAFGTSTVCFSAVAFLRRPRDFRKLLGSPVVFAALNVTTAAAWLTFFFGLKHLEPAVVATLYNGIGPLVVLALEGFGCAKGKNRPSRVEWLCYAGVAGALASLAVIVLTNRSGLLQSSSIMQSGALAAVVAGGATIAISHMIARWFNDAGVTSAAVMGTRFMLTVLVAAAAEWVIGGAASGASLAGMASIAGAAFALIAVPSFMLQLGIARASPLAVNVMRSLGPVFVFAVQQFDGRLRFSGATLICVASFCFFATAASLLRGWGEVSAGVRPRGSDTISPNLKMPPGRRP